MQRPIENVPLRAGAHPTRDDGVCAMEMVAWLAGEAHSDEPRCACPVLGALVRASNDAMTDAQRDRFLRPFAALRLAQAFARHQRAALWVLQRAGEGVPPARFVAAAAQLARLQGDTAAWSAVVALVERMVAITPATVAAADAATAAAATATAG